MVRGTGESPVDLPTSLGAMGTAQHEAPDKAPVQDGTRHCLRGGTILSRGIPTK